MKITSFRLALVNETSSRRRTTTGRVPRSQRPQRPPKPLSFLPAVSAFALPLNSLDSALFVLLPPGSYTLQLTNGANRGSSALLELYELP